MSNLKDDFLAQMREKGATTDNAVNLLRIGPALVSEGYSEDDIFRALMFLRQTGVIILDETRNSVRFP